MVRRLRTGLVVLGTVAMIGAGVAFTTAEAASASGTNSLDLCVVEPGFVTPGDNFGLTTTGPKNFNDTQTLAASACGSYRSLPSAGTYTVTQSQTPPGWSVAQIYCYAVAAANHRLGTVDLSSSSATFKVSGPTSCIFAELPAGGGGSGGFSGGAGSSSKSGTTTTTTKSTGTTTTTKSKPPITFINICQRNPQICQFKP
jgi:hypothetical protein